MSPLKKYQTFWRRFGAGIADGILFTPLMWGVHTLLPHADTVHTFVPLFIVAQFSFITYSVLMHAKFGQTLGKMATNVKVLDISEEPLSFEQAFMRDAPYLGILILRSVFGLFWAFDNGVPSFERFLEHNNVVLEFVDSGWFFIEVTTMLFSDKRRALHDYIADSVVVKIQD